MKSFETIHEAKIDKIGLVAFGLEYDLNSIVAYLINDEETYRKLFEECSVIDDFEDCKQVGSIEVDDGWLEAVNVDDKYQKKGIGCILVSLAIDYLDLHKISCIEFTNKQDNRALTVMGQQLIASCIRKDIVKSDMCEHLDNGKVSTLICKAFDEPKEQFSFSGVKPDPLQRKLTEFFSQTKKQKLDREGEFKFVPTSRMVKSKLQTPSFLKELKEQNSRKRKRDDSLDSTVLNKLNNS